MTAARVVFVHGLWMTGAELRWLRRRLESRFGFDTEIFTYRTVSEPLDSVLERLAAAVSRGGTSQTVHVIGHSLGGVVACRLFERYTELPPGRVLCLGSPLAGSQAARRFERFRIGHRMIGALVVAELLGARDCRWSTARELGVIAGTRPVGLGRLIAGFSEPNDGTVALRETRIEGATDHLALPVSHFGMLLSTRVVEECGRFLRDGRFSLRAA